MMPLDFKLEDSPTYNEAVQKGKQQGKLEGKLESKLEIAKAFLMLGKNTLQEIAQATDLPLATIKQLALELKK